MRPTDISDEGSGYVMLLVYDAPGQGQVEESVGPDRVVDRFVALVRSLDGAGRTLVAGIGADGIAHLAVGGDAARGMVAYATFDNVTFHQLLCERPGADPVRLVVGGQPAEYPAAFVVSIDLALLAAVPFLMDGRLADEVKWTSR